MSCNDTKIDDLQRDTTVVVYHSSQDYHRITVGNLSPIVDGGIFEPCDQGSWVDPIDGLNSETTIYTEDSEGDCDEFLEVPEVCDGFWSSYYLDGMDGSSFNASGCTSCEDSSQTAWDGAFDECLSVCCGSNPDNYYANYFGANYGWDDYSVGSGAFIKKIYYAQLFFYYDAWNGAYYYVYVGCAYWDGGSYIDQTVWDGYKYCGRTPVGDYERSGGCDSAASVRVV